MNTIESLWNLDFSSDSASMPRDILAQQAKYLEEATRNILVGEVKTVVDNYNRQSNNGSNMLHGLVIKAPSLGNYQFTLLTVSQNLSVYPLELTDNLSERKWTIASEEEFIARLAEILGSHQVQKAIYSLTGPINQE